MVGLPTTAACPSYAYLPERDAPAVAALRAAGAVVLGTTNLDQFATGLVGTRSPYGAVRHAHAPERVSGGSSSGSAVAVALGIADLALGTDTHAARGACLPRSTESSDSSPPPVWSPPTAWSRPARAWTASASSPVRSPRPRRPSPTSPPGPRALPAAHARRARRGSPSRTPPPSASSTTAGRPPMPAPPTVSPPPAPSSPRSTSPLPPGRRPALRRRLRRRAVHRRRHLRRRTSRQAVARDVRVVRSGSDRGGDHLPRG